VSGAAPQFLGRFEFKLDKRCRLQIPARWREALGDECLVTVARPVHLPGLTVNCLTTWPKAVFVRRCRELQAATDHLSDSAVDEEWLLSGTPTIQKPAVSGRLKIDFARLEAVGLAPGAVVVLAGLLDRFEVWAPDNWSRLAAVASASEAFRRLI
jgi:DNA-binding transcriptional regulator/RsmH inhibitor MraZ